MGGFAKRTEAARLTAATIRHSKLLPGKQSEAPRCSKQHDLTRTVSAGDHLQARRGRSVTSFKWRIAAVAAALIVIGSCSLWYLESPVWTLKSMKDAAQSHDADALNAYIDYPALRESLEAQLTARMRTEAQKDKSGVGALARALGALTLKPLINILVSPAGMRALLANREEDMGPAASALRVPKEPVIVRRNFSEFVVTAKQQPSGGLVFKRRGLSWMLSGVELPPDALT